MINDSKIKLYEFDFEFFEFLSLHQKLSVLSSLQILELYSRITFIYVAKCINIVDTFARLVHRFKEETEVEQAALKLT